ncbi:DinB family protein [Zhihengliuella halotolerans]|uniref:Uncharacterized protein DUF664 n=1 Tax=Zhihengliuella halotolerans TaxID=370736 RepID=A0A4Q8AI79_9MICC|nr:DinB family protein [Zhihengliuella halotolerans]RZU63621.1 uncharacterized protein DUF664 [Zhihengliuella halotolerans]
MMSESEMLTRYLQEQREALLWKLDGVGEYDARRPMTATGTNLLGLVKHVASMEIGYFGEACGRPNAVDMPWLAETAEPNDDMYATVDESREWVVDLYRRAWANTNAVIAELGLDAEAVVPWWGEKTRRTDVRRLIVHMIAETARHTGHADIVREQIDGFAGLYDGNDNLPDDDRAWWDAYRARVQVAAEAFA